MVICFADNSYSTRKTRLDKIILQKEDSVKKLDKHTLIYAFVQVFDRFKHQKNKFSQ